MISINKAQEIINQSIPESKTEEVELKDSLQKFLAEDIISPLSSPQFNNSAMDGFAVKWEDVQDVLINNKLKLVGESQAGIPYKEKMNFGEAIKINTGAKLPEDADSVIPVEDTEVEDGKVKILKVKKYQQNVRFEGEEFKKGKIILNKGTKLTAAQIGLIASVGIQKVKVYSSPKVSIIVTGTELIDNGKDLKEGEIYDSNSIMIKSSVKQSNGEVVYTNHAKDDLQETINIFKTAIDKSDIIIFCGGVSMGEHDYVRTAAKKIGFKEKFWKVKQKPGKPLFFAKRNEKLLFGLPGNPVSAFMCYNHYVNPVIQKLQGNEKYQTIINARLKREVINKGIRNQLMRVKISLDTNELPTAEVLDYQASHMLTSIANANGYIIVEENQTIKENEIVKVYLFVGGLNGIY